jgi:hypothetical protein
MILSSPAEALNVMGKIAAWPVLVGLSAKEARAAPRAMLAPMSHSIRILGIDPGLNATGWGVIIRREPGCRWWAMA